MEKSSLLIIASMELNVAFITFSVTTNYQKDLVDGFNQSFQKSGTYKR